VADAGQGIEQELLVVAAAVRLQPPHAAAEGDEPDAVVRGEVRDAECAGGSHRVAEGRDIERVDEEDDVGGPLGVSLVDPGLAEPGGEPPVDGPPVVAGEEPPAVGVLGAGAALAGPMVAAVDAGPGRPHEHGQSGRVGEDAHDERRPDDGLGGADAGRWGPANGDGAEVVRTPAVGGERDPVDPAPPARQWGGGEPVASGDPPVGGERDREVEATRRTVGFDREVYTNLDSYIPDAGIGFESSFKLKKYRFFLSGIVAQALKGTGGVEARVSVKSYH